MVEGHASNAIDKVVSNLPGPIITYISGGNAAGITADVREDEFTKDAAVRLRLEIARMKTHPTFSIK